MGEEQRDGFEDYRTEIRRKVPGLAKKADHGNSPGSAWKIQCRVCVPTLADAKDCRTFTCPGFPYGYATTPRPDGAVPTVEEYDALLPQYTDEERAAMGERLRAAVGGGEEE